MRLKLGTRVATYPTQGGLIQQSNLVYQGSFRLPEFTPIGYFGGGALTYWPAHDSLLMTAQGGANDQKVGEISIPALGTGSLNTLPRATALQPVTDILKGKLYNVNGNTGSGVQIGQILIDGLTFYVSAACLFDNGSPRQSLTHFKCDLTACNGTFSNAGLYTASNVTGPFQVGTGFQYLEPTDTTRIGGFVSQYMCEIPAAHQADFGGTHLTGAGTGLSVISRTSMGPATSCFSPSDLGVTIPAPVAGNRPLLGYPNGTPASLNHPTLGEYEPAPPTTFPIDTLYNGLVTVKSMVFPDGWNSILFYGSAALSAYCYGAATQNPALHLQPVPGQPGQHYCYDPVDSIGGTGPKGYPVRPIVYAYDAADLLAVKNGSLNPWDLQPYDVWDYTIPYQQLIGSTPFESNIDLGIYNIMGAAYDTAGQRMFVSTFRTDDQHPIIAVYSVQ